MSIRHANQPQFPLRGLRLGPAAPWVRPADWPGLPWIPDNEQAFVGLLAVLDTDHESVTVWCQAAYTVDWGDGSVPQNQVSGGSLDHTYTYATLSSRVTSRGYKTAIVKITPQAGQNLTKVDLQYYPSGWGPMNGKSSPWLDIQVNAEYATSLVFGASLLRPTQVERVHIRKHALTNLANMLSFMRRLRSVPLFDTSGVTNIQNLFYSSDALDELPLFDFSNVTVGDGAFFGMTSLPRIPAYNLSKLVNGTGLLRGCTSQYTAGNINLSALTNASQLFYQNSSLRVIGALNLSLVTDLTNWLYEAGSVVRSQVTGVKVTHSYVNCSLSATALNEVFTNLASGVTGQTITITGNPGAGTCDQSIATTKGWTVVN